MNETLENKLERISTILKDTKSAQVLEPADFYFAFKHGIVQPYLKDAWFQSRVEENKIKLTVVSKPFESKGELKFTSRKERDLYIVENKAKGYETLMKETGLSRARISKIFLEFKKKENKNAN